MSLRSERPASQEIGYSFHLYINAEDRDLVAVLSERIIECQRKADAAIHPTAKAEWLRHIKDLQSLMTETE